MYETTQTALQTTSFDFIASNPLVCLSRPPPGGRIYFFEKLELNLDGHRFGAKMRRQEQEVRSKTFEPG